MSPTRKLFSWPDSVEHNSCPTWLLSTSPARAQLGHVQPVPERARIVNKHAQPTTNLRVCTSLLCNQRVRTSFPPLSPAHDCHRLVYFAEASPDLLRHRRDFAGPLTRQHNYPHRSTTKLRWSLNLHHNQTDPLIQSAVLVQNQSPTRIHFAIVPPRSTSSSTDPLRQ